MKEYTCLTLISVIIVYLIDKYLGTNLFTKRVFWKFQLLVTALTIGVDYFISGLPVVVFNENHILGIRIASTPIENLFFGFSLITLNLILFEYGKQN